MDKNLAPKATCHLSNAGVPCVLYKSDDKDMFMLAQAMAILTPLAPKDTQDVEILGLSGAINKRIFELNANPKYLEEAIWYYDRGFSLKQDYYNGINAAYMLYRKASIQKANADDEWEDTRTDADSTRNKVLKVSLAIETGAGFAEQGDRVWVLFTIAEAYNYKGDTDKQTAYEQKPKPKPTRWTTVLL